MVLCRNLAVALVASWAWFAWSRRSFSIADVQDQAALDGVLHTMPREAIRRLDAEDFGIAWPDDIAYPLTRWRRDVNDVEHAFLDADEERL